MKRGYYAHNNDDDQAGLAIVAPSAKAAKKMAWGSGEFIYGDTGWLDIHVRWVRHASVDSLPIGVVDDCRAALICGLHGALMEYPCDECRLEADVSCYHGRVLCDKCIKKFIAADADEIDI